MERGFGIMNHAFLLALAISSKTMCVSCPSCMLTESDACIKNTLHQNEWISFPSPKKQQGSKKRVSTRGEDAFGDECWTWWCG